MCEHDITGSCRSSHTIIAYSYIKRCPENGFAVYIALIITLSINQVCGPMSLHMLAWYAFSVH